MKKLFTLLMVASAVIFTPRSQAQVTMFLYTFEAGDVPEPGAVGSPAFSIVGSLTGPNYFTGANQTTCTSASGTAARSHTGWNTGDAYRFTVDATGYESMTFSYCQRTSNVTVNNFLCRVSCDAGMNWSTIVASYVPPSTANFSYYSGTIPALCDEAASLWIEIYKENDAGNAMNNIRIDNVLLAGTAVLPVEMLSFEVEEVSGVVDLKWVTATETGNDFYAVERSQDGHNFHELSKISGAGTTTETTYYQFTDPSPLDGINYYRLRQVDFDGKSYYSPVRSLNFGDLATLSVFPTIVSNEVNIRLNDVKNTAYDAEVEVFDIYGKSVYKLPFSDNFTFAADGLAPGTYFVKCTNNYIVYTGSFVKL